MEFHQHVISMRNTVTLLLLATTSAVSVAVYKWTRRKPMIRSYTGHRVKDICLVNTVTQWEEIYPELVRHVNDFKVVGLDCEWVPITQKHQHHPVALLQIATASGLCLLVKLCNMSGQIPASLKHFLADKRILKVGVSVLEDAHKLSLDYELSVNGCVDLRYALNRVRGIFNCHSWGLQGLAEGILGRQLNKDIEIQCGQWDAKTLTLDQLDYASCDALVAMDIFVHLILAKQLGKKPDVKLTESYSYLKVWKTALSLVQGIVDVKFSRRSVNRINEDVSVSDGKCKTKINSMNGDSRKAAAKAYTVRLHPLYYNCQLLAPDGQKLCTCDLKKALWYIEKGLGEKVNEEPLTIQLNFEPSGRPDSDRYYYLQEKDNICVVCGKGDSYTRKNVVPHEYRRYFPIMLKDHKSHDILLLCPDCHALSAERDANLRLWLSQHCHAPLDSGSMVKIKQDNELHKVKSAAKALIVNAGKLPIDRTVVLQDLLKTYYGVTELTDELLDNARNMDIRIINSQWVAHGKKVVDYMLQSGGLVEFERMWRSHFLETMKPRFLPTYWSVDHNHDKYAALR